LAHYRKGKKRKKGRARFDKYNTAIAKKEKEGKGGFWIWYEGIQPPSFPDSTEKRKDSSISKDFFTKKEALF